MVQIAASLLSADFMHLEESIKKVSVDSDILHLDIMDGEFVPNISFGFPVVNAIARTQTLPLDAHLMISHPERYLDRLAEAKVKMVSVHMETLDDPIGIAQQIRDYGMSPGLALDPDVMIEDIFEYLKYYDFVLVMSVFAGFGGQKFIEESYSRIARVKEEIIRQGLNCLIEIDGGVTLDNCKKIANVGADILVVGNTIFNAENPAAMVAALKSTANLC